MTNHESDIYYGIPIYQICDRIINGIVFDTLHIIIDKKNTFKKDIINEIIRWDDRDSKFGTYKNPIDIAIAKLEAVCFIDIFQNGNRDMIRLTEHGEYVARNYMSDLFDKLVEEKIKDPDKIPTVLMNSIVVQKVINNAIKSAENN